VTEQLRLQASLRDVEAESEFDNCLSSLGSINQRESEFDQSNYKIDAIYNNGKTKKKLAYTFSETERRSLSDNQVTFDVEGALEQLQYLGALNHSSDNSILYGLD
jgi:hypothetical protein